MPSGGTLLMELAEALLRRPQWRNRAEVASALGVHQGTITPWLNYLEFFHAIRETREGLEARTPDLLATMARVRAANLRPDRPAAIRADAGEVHDRLEDHGVPHVFGMFTAANRWAFYEPVRDVHLYVDRSHRPDLRDALDALAPRSRAPAGELQVYVENLGALSHQTREGLPVTSPFQTTVDLRAHPEGGAHADFLERNLLPRLPGGEVE